MLKLNVSKLFILYILKHEILHTQANNLVLIQLSKIVDISNLHAKLN